MLLSYRIALYLGLVTMVLAPVFGLIYSMTNLAAALIPEAAHAPGQREEYLATALSSLVYSVGIAMVGAVISVAAWVVKLRVNRAESDAADDALIQAITKAREDSDSKFQA